MTASKVFKEVISQGLSPLILTGDTKSTYAKFVVFLTSHYKEDEYLILDTLDSNNIDLLRSMIILKTSSLKFVLLTSNSVTAQSWQKLLKILEDYTPNTQIIIISNGSIPKTIESRSFKCHIPANETVIEGYSGTEAFSVGSWLISVDTRNREQLLKSCQDWSEGHTNLLVAEINEQLLGKSLLKLSLDKRLSNPNRLMAALFMINDNLMSPTAHIYAGLRLMV